MAYLHEDILREKAEEFIKVLAKYSIKSEIVMIRDYSVKISIEKENMNYGNLIIDYKAKKNTFSIRMQELKYKSIEEDLFILWEKGEFLNTSGEKGKLPDTTEGKDEIPGASEGGDFFEIYVDGSFINDSIGYGVVILKNGNLFKELTGQVTDPVFMGSRQVGGEIAAVIEALKWCRNSGINEISIYYDFENLKKWVTGEFSTNTIMSRVYRDYVLSSGIKIRWNKVDSHTGIRWNERADQLAKNGSGVRAAEAQAVEMLPEDCKNLYPKNIENIESIENIENRSNNILKELEETAEEFAFFLENNGFIAEYLRIDNGMAAKICVERDGKTLGYVNIYNTSKLHLQPRYHEIRDEELRVELDKLWDSFMGNLQALQE
ncbi:MAG: hypothetical protein GYA02_18305 [Clostridiaceae bacterium]|nr:hypothetical protein [Clostridiaceae bacterium]